MEHPPKEFRQHINMHLSIKSNDVQATVQKIVAFLQDIMPKDDDFSWSLDTGQQVIKNTPPTLQSEKKKDK